ncbi:MAG: UpxY family transcription antiterminator [Prolixibacteraceae bacterium]
MNIQLNTGEGPSALHWYAVYTRSRAEKKAAEDFRRKGIEFYLPIKKVRKVWTTRTRVVDFPLISCYLFVRVDHRRYYDVLMTPGVMWYVCFNGKPAIIPDRQIRSLMVLEKVLNESLVVTSEHIEKDDLIEVLSGPLAGVQGEVVRIKGKSHLVLRFRSLGCCIHVSQEALHFRKV